MRQTTIFLAALALTACERDSDGDGLEVLTFGSDPLKPYTDDAGSLDTE